MNWCSVWTQVAPSLWTRLTLASWIFFLLVEGIISWPLLNFYIRFHFFKGVSVILCLSIYTLCSCLLILKADSHSHFPAICLSVSPFPCFRFASLNFSCVVWAFSIALLPIHSVILPTIPTLCTLLDLCWSLSHLSSLEKGQKKKKKKREKGKDLLFW